MLGLELKAKHPKRVKKIDMSVVYIATGETAGGVGWGGWVGRGGEWS